MGERKGEIMVTKHVMCPWESIQISANLLSHDIYLLCSCRLEEFPQKEV